MKLRPKDNQTVHKIYTPTFYHEQQNYSLNSARIIVPLILDVFSVKSVVDIGCGVGTWMSVFLENGITDIKGFDVSDLPEEYYFADKQRITTGYDFSSGNLDFNVKAEMAICLEVAEHLSESVSDNLIHSLVSVAPVVIFSAAFPGQTGVNHINEQPPWYWRKKFGVHDFTEIDFLRPLIWWNDKVAWWYRQNITCYVSLDFLMTNQRVMELHNRIKDPNSRHRLTLVSETILKNLLFSAHHKKQPLKRIINLFKGSS